MDDPIKARRLWELSRDVTRYTFYLDAIDLGITYTPRDLSFFDLLIFTYIKRARDGRKN